MSVQMTYAEALIKTLDEIMATDSRALVIGSYWLGFNPHRLPLWNAFAYKYDERVYYPPISELGICGVAVGAALKGLRPLVDLAAASFAFQGWAQIVNEAANVHYLSAGQSRAPVVFHLLGGGRAGSAAQHTHSPQAMFWNTPGLEIMLPASPRDVAGLLRTAAESDNPTVFMDHLLLMDQVGEVPQEPFRIPFGQADVKRSGRDVTVVATSVLVPRALEAAAQLAREGIDVEVIDPRTLVPFDRATLLRSVAKTGYLVIADECHTSCGVAAEIAAIVAGEAFSDLRGPIARVTTPDVPIPCSPGMDAFVQPSAEKIGAAVRALLGQVETRASRLI
jgi:pyruvate dehydrogenase E1 component beta subunit